MPAALENNDKEEAMATSEPMTHTVQAELPADPEALSGEAEPWEPWETRLVAASLAIGAAGLVVLGWLVDHFILS